MGAVVSARLPGQMGPWSVFYDLQGVDNVAWWESCDLRDRAYVSRVGSVLHRSCTVFHLTITTGRGSNRRIYSKIV